MMIELPEKLEAALKVQAEEIDANRADMFQNFGEHF